MPTESYNHKKYYELSKLIVDIWNKNPNLLDEITREALVDLYPEYMDDIRIGFMLMETNGVTIEEINYLLKCISKTYREIEGLILHDI